jgi:hypothetical protein
MTVVMEEEARAAGAVEEPRAHGGTLASSRLLMPPLIEKRRRGKSAIRRKTHSCRSGGTERFFTVSRPRIACRARRKRGGRRRIVGAGPGASVRGRRTLRACTMKCVTPAADTTRTNSCSSSYESRSSTPSLAVGRWWVMS